MWGHFQSINKLYGQSQSFPSILFLCWKMFDGLKKKWKNGAKKNKWRPSFRLFAFAIIDFPLFVLLSGVCSSGLRRVFMVGAFSFTWGMVPMHYTILVAFTWGMVPMHYTILVAFTRGMVPMDYTILVLFSYILPSLSPLTWSIFENDGRPIHLLLWG